MRKPLLHLVFWLLFYLSWDRVMYFYMTNSLNGFYFSAIDVSLFMIAFYVVYLVIMPYYFKQKNLWAALVLSTLLTLSLAGLYSGLMLLFLRHGLVPIHFDFYWNYTDLQYNRFFIALIGVLSGCFLKLAMDRIAANRRMEQMEKQKTMAELTYLKAQINPHFLFNSLNSLYAQLEFSPNDAKNTLTSLADLLRYQLYDCDADLIPVNKEIAYLRNYFDLQRIRNDNCRADFMSKEPEKGLLIAPLLLIPFMENAFKYVSDTLADNSIRIKLSFNENELLFSCTNTIEKSQASNSQPAANGIGLANVKKRLELIYPNNHTLQAGIKNDSYVVNLTVNLSDA